MGFNDVRIAKERPALRSMKKSSFLETMGFRISGTFLCVNRRLNKPFHNQYLIFSASYEYARQNAGVDLARHSEVFSLVEGDALLGSTISTAFLCLSSALAKML